MYNLHKRGCYLKKKVLIAFGLVLLLISIYSAIAQQDNETIVVPLEEVVGNTTDEPKTELISEEEPEPELITESPQPRIVDRVINFGKDCFSKVKNALVWVFTRDYPAVAHNALRFILSLHILIKILLIIIALLIILIIWAYYFRDTRGNNLRKARKHHKKGEAAHKKGDEEEAEYHYQKAAEYREKAQEQW